MNSHQPNRILKTQTPSCYILGISPSTIRNAPPPYNRELDTHNQEKEMCSFQHDAHSSYMSPFYIRYPHNKNHHNPQEAPKKQIKTPTTRRNIENKTKKKQNSKTKQTKKQYVAP
ncbi:hypothetical protein [Escherichia coli]|uniref:hypothetical protein n=1 Tax=Escherichia coli TaxID=562 RepID=UPI00263634A2|nr:hypothetical protein [Escherichia coli]WKA87673.1 hypothetical protein QYF42_24930 [Escherichia coli]